MPIYEYVCNDCKKHFEMIISSSGGEIVKCRKCGSLNVKKTISASCIRVGGGGNSPPAGALSGCSAKSGFS